MIVGDANNDNRINVADFNILKPAFGKGCADSGYDDRAEFNGDCRINVGDFNLLKSNFGQGGARSSPPPRGREQKHRHHAQVMCWVA